MSFKCFVENIIGDDGNSDWAEIDIKHKFTTTMNTFYQMFPCTHLLRNRAIDTVLRLNDNGFFVGMENDKKEKKGRGYSLSYF
jgi:hypothetical protein